MWSWITAADEFRHIGLQFMVVPRPQFLFAFVSLDCSLVLNCSFCMEGLLGRTRLSIIARFLAHAGLLARGCLLVIACSWLLARDCLLVIACSCWIARLYWIAWTLDCLLLVHAISLDYWLALNCWLMLHLCCKQIKIKLVIQQKL